MVSILAAGFVILSTFVPTPNACSVSLVLIHLSFFLFVTSELLLHLDFYLVGFNYLLLFLTWIYLVGFSYLLLLLARATYFPQNG
jgi:hypothetical protein